MNFSESLRPFDGYEMDYALGTSYSLSLESLLFIPVTLFYGEEMKATREELSGQCLTGGMLESLMKVPEKVQVFCHRGKILKPPFYHEILSFWEKSIEQIQMDSAFKSFHPKIWLVRYKHVKNPNDIKYRFISTSRNLTTSTDWDLAVCMDGSVGKKKHPENRPLFDFVNYLDGRAKKKVTQAVLDEILYIDFELDDSQSEYRFHPIGFNKYIHPLLVDDTFNEKLLIISPFLDKKTIERHKENTSQLSLYSLANELDKIDESTLNDVSVWQLNPHVDGYMEVEHESNTDDTLIDAAINSGYEPDTYPDPVSLHAKCYIAENKGYSRWFVGSANCTAPAKDRNVEFLTEIAFQRKQNTIAQTEEKLIATPDGEGLFVEYEPAQDNKEAAEKQKNEQYLRSLIFEISNLHFNASIQPNDNQRYDLCIVQEDALKLDKEWEVGIRPLSVMPEAEQRMIAGITPQTFVFKDIEEIKLTPFLLCNIYHENEFFKHFVLELEIDFPESRMRKIFSSIICDQERLLKYLNGILSDNDSYPLLELQPERTESPVIHSAYAGIDYPALYEKMLRTSSRDRRKLKVIDQIMSQLIDEKDSEGNLIVDDKLAAFFKVFSTFGDDEIQ